MEAGDLVAFTAGVQATDFDGLQTTMLVNPTSDKEFMLFMYLGTTDKPDEMNLDNLLMCLGYVKEATE